MCGIVGYVGKNNSCIKVLLDGLRRLEYRGYDSAGIAYLENEKIVIKKESGNLENLSNVVDASIDSNIGIGHTRWATHGKADRKNSHPHRMGKFTLVHNGIIENYNEIKSDLMSKGYVFESETDTEVVCALLDYMYRTDKDILKCVRKLGSVVEGSYALGIICDDCKDSIFAAKKNSPLIIGLNGDEKFIASDVPAILDKTNKYIILEDGDYAQIDADNVRVFAEGKEKFPEVKEFEFSLSDIDKQGYEHYMLKEIHEQPEVFKKTTKDYLKDDLNNLIDMMPDFNKYSKIRIVACGSATHAGLVGRQLIERFANVKVEVNTASEFRYDKLFLDKDELVIAISQSGETADTLEAIKIAKNNGNDTLGIINAKGSSIAREAKMVLYTEAGKEIAVATTKAYSAQVAMLALIALNLAVSKNIIEKSEMLSILRDTKNLPNYISILLDDDEYYRKVAESIKEHNDIFFIGRGIDYALAMEGSLKLKEISYKHSEAYAAGELKHGTISLIEEGTPVIAIVTDEKVASKTISNIKEVKSRGAYVILVTNKEFEDNSFYDEKILIPKVNELLSPLLTVIPLQIISYELAKINGCSIDKPKNLAKSVTVE
ncbi:MAG: glutamine--fructose-6-phosphate transaminase (isomerizing) [Firmicutes bacterium]|nr:glutamine--fructose-6-phosphate transaminase (isomerizing) [Bacillota bacterium]